MATSGQFLWNPDLAEIVDEAFDRCRIDPALITARHILSARRSMRFMLSDWATDEYDDFRIERMSFTLSQGSASYSGASFLPSHVIDVVSCFLRRDGSDTPVMAMSRRDHADIPSKDTSGRPDRVFIDKQRDGLVATFWPVPENSTDEFFFDAVLKFEDHDKAANNADIPYYLRDAFSAGLAARLAEKYAPPEMEEKLWIKAAQALKKGRNASREMVEIRFAPGQGRRR